MTNISEEENIPFSIISNLLERASKDPVNIDITEFFDNETHQLVVMPNMPHRANICKSKTNEIVERFDLSDNTDQQRFLDFFALKPTKYNQ